MQIHDFCLSNSFLSETILRLGSTAASNSVDLHAIVLWVSSNFFDKSQAWIVLVFLRNLRKSSHRVCTCLVCVFPRASGWLCVQVL